MSKAELRWTPLTPGSKQGTISHAESGRDLHLISFTLDEAVQTYPETVFVVKVGSHA